MNDQEYARWVWTSTLKDAGKGLLTYAVFLGTFWLTIG
jgi:hypothetical protein